MASLRRFPGSKFWFACVTLPDGRRVQRSTKETDRRRALRLAEAMEELTRRKRTARQVREVIADLHERITGESLPSVTVRAFLDSWLARKKPETAPATWIFYRTALQKFLAFLGPEGAGRELADVTREDVTRFRNEQAAALTAKTCNHDLRALKTVFKAARRDGLIVEDPSEFVDAVKQDSQPGARRPFTVEELKAVLAACDPEWRSMVLLGAYTGQRLADIAAMTWSNVDLGRDEIRLTSRKTGRRMVLPLAPALRRHLESLSGGQSPDAPLHPRAHAVVSSQKRSGSLSNQFTAILARAGLREKKSHHKAAAGAGRGGRREGSALSFHCLRRTATSFLHDAGVPAAVAQELVGHDSAEVHRLYVNVGRAALKKAAHALPDLLNGQDADAGGRP